VNGRALKLASDSDEIRFGPRGELRETFATNGRVHIDRWLPFLVLNRSENPAESIARRVAVNCAAYMVWSAEEDVEAQAALEVVLPSLQERLDDILLIELHDAPFELRKHDDPVLPSFDIGVAATRSKAAQVALEAFCKSAEDICIDLRSPDVWVEDVQPSLLVTSGACDRLSVTIPQIHRAPDRSIYPEMTHDLIAAIIDSLLCASAAFAGAVTDGPAPHYRSHGRSAFLAAALKADKKLDALARSFDFLLSISPINTSEARARFFESGEQHEPEFRYRPLTVDPDSVKRDLYAIDLSILEDLLLERLLAEKRREIDMQLTMLATRNTHGFRPASMLLYGAVGDELLKNARTILDRVKTKTIGGERCTAPEIAAAARDLIGRYRSVDDRFEAEVEIRDDVFGMLVSGGRLMISSDSVIARRRLDPLLAHEVSVHLLTYFNGATQGLTIFRTGLAHYEGIQEGLGVFAEWAVGGLTPARLRLLAGRVIAVDAMIHGANFIEVYRLLRDESGFGRKSAFDITARVFRSGGLAKDAIYLKGFLDIAERVATGWSLDAFWLGKIAPEHVDAVDELLQRGLLHPPIYVPEFLSRDDAKKRIDALREDGSLERLIELE